jgi:tetratricopeptide (TPR) repeat protein
MKAARQRDPLEALLRAGLAAQSAGQLELAIEKYRAALAREPRCADACHLLAQIRHLQGEASEAVALVQRAIAIAPRIAMYRCTHGVILRALGSERDALAAFQTALSLDPRYVPAQKNVAALLAAMGMRDDATTAYAKAAALDPSDIEIWLSLARLLIEAGRPGDAAAAAERAVRLDPRGAVALQAWYSAAAAADALQVIEPMLARLVADDPTNVAAALILVDARLRLERVGEALGVAELLSRSAPDDPRVWQRMGLALAAADRQADAAAAFARALASDEDDETSAIGLGNTWQRRGRPDEALAIYEDVARRHPMTREGWYNAGVALGTLDREDEAVRRYDRAIEIDRGYTAALNNRAQSLLRLGHLGAAWSDYRWREGARAMALPVERWPSDLAGRRIHVHAEQGIGDHLFFLRFAACAVERGATLTVEAERRIEPMVARSGLVPVDTIPDGAEAARMGDLPWLLHCGDDDVPPPLALPVLADRAARVSVALASLPRPIIGATWRAGGVDGQAGLHQARAAGDSGRSARPTAGRSCRCSACRTRRIRRPSSTRWGAMWWTSAPGTTTSNRCSP